MILDGKQDINQADIDSVVNILKSDFLTQGPKIPLFQSLKKEMQDDVLFNLQRILS